MKIKLYGTAAAEGIPALFCNCDVCLNAQKVKGREIRSRSQSLINDTVLIDFPGDTFLHKIYSDLPLSDLEHLVVTHSHHDHFFGEDLMMRMSGYSNNLTTKLNVYGNDTVKAMYNRAQNLEGFKDESRLSYTEIFEYKPLNIAGLTIAPLLADHSRTEKCFILQIEEGDKSILYGHDTGRFPQEVWEFWKNNPIKFDCVILDCTHQEVRVERNHMSFYDNVDMKDAMIALGYADLNTEFVITHFSHNGGCTHEETSKWAEDNGFTCAYDGIEFSL